MLKIGLIGFHEPDVPISREHELGVRVSTKKGSKAPSPGK